VKVVLIRVIIEKKINVVLKTEMGQDSWDNIFVQMTRLLRNGEYL